MKKIILTIVCVCLAIGAVNAQKGDKSAVIKGGLITDPSRFAIGAEGRYGITENIRFAPDVLIVLPKNKVTGLNINANVQYVFPLENELSIYPFAGLAMHNGRMSGSKTEFMGQTIEQKAVSSTSWGFNIGCGGDYNLSSTNFLSAQFQYTFSDWDGASILIGYGFKF